VNESTPDILGIICVVGVIILAVIGAISLSGYTNRSEGRLQVSLCMSNDNTDTEYDCRKRHDYWGDLK